MDWDTISNFIIVFFGVGLPVGVVYFGMAFLLVRAYDDSRQDITDEIAAWNRREREAKPKSNDIEWLH